MDNDNIKDLRSSIALSAIGIPPQLLEHEYLRYILIRKDGTRKLPAEKKWQIDHNYCATAPKLRGWMRGGGNYGVATGFGGLVVLDADEVEKLIELNVIPKLPTTLTIRTGGGGLHFYFFCKGLKKIIKLFHPETNEHLGEIQSNGAFVIGPNSVHKSGNKYEITNASKIATIEYDDLMDIIRRLRVKKVADKSNTDFTGKYDGVDIERIATPMHQKNRMGCNGREIYGENPFHGATKAKDRGTSTNFHMNISKGVWHCHACGSGGGWMELLAVAEGIIRCDQAGPGCLTAKQRRELIEIAESRGIIKIRIPDETPDLNIIPDRIVVDKLPNKLPDNKVVVIRKPPRIGGTHWGVEMLSRFVEGNYFTHRHAIVEHAIRVAEEIRMKSVVWVVGMGQPGACRREKVDCSSCPLKLNQVDHMKQENIASSLLHELGVLTAKKIPENLCPYWTLKMAEPSARYCFTVANNLDSIRPRKIVVLDEDPTLQVLYPPSIEIATIKNVRGEIHVKNKLTDLDDELKLILHDGKNKKLRPYAKKIAEIRDIIEANRNDDAKALVKKIEISLKNWEGGAVHVREVGEMNGDISLEACVRCLSHLYKDTPVTLMSNVGGSKSIFLIGDERKPVFSMAWMDKAEKVVIIGATKAELFAKDFGGVVVEIENFGYKDRYTVLLLKEDEKGGGAKEQKNILRVALRMWGNSERCTRMPFMVLTGSERTQKRAVESVPGAKGVKSEREMGINGNM